MALSELELQRQKAIERNKQLLRQLELSGASAAFAKEIQPKKAANKPKPKPRVPRPKKEREDVPRRKSRRLEGKAADGAILTDEDDYRVKKEQYDWARDRTRDRIEGELKLQEVVKRGDWDSALEVLTAMPGKSSIGDYFDMVKTEDQTGSDVSKARDVYSNLQLHEEYYQAAVKATDERIYSLAFHPTIDKQIVLAGDKMGQLGIWTVADDSQKDEEEGDSNVVALKVHSRSICKIVTDWSPKVYTASYDGSVRVLDLKAQMSEEAFVYDPNPRDPVGVSDIHLIDGNVMYYTTLEGSFGIHDFRTPDTRTEYQLHEKKIGGFAVNPIGHGQIATGSLDRTMKLWDVKKLEAPKSSIEAYGSYDSRLSISSADWNSGNQIVANGYDDTINVFDMDTASLPELKPTVRLKHNCQTGRWVSILKARWQARPADGLQKFVIANMSKYVDIYSGSGQQLAHLGDDRMTAVPAVVQLHPTQPWVSGGNSTGKLYLFK